VNFSAIFSLIKAESFLPSLYASDKEHLHSQQPVFKDPSKSSHVIDNQSIATQSHICFPRQILAS
jgi:hypothetical protein